MVIIPKKDLAKSGYKIRYNLYKSLIKPWNLAKFSNSKKIGQYVHWEAESAAVVVLDSESGIHQQHMPTTSAFTQNTWYCRHASTHRFCFSCVQGLVNCLLLCHEKEEEEEGIVVGPASNAAAPASSKLPTSMTSIWWGFKEETEEAALEGIEKSF
jgi:hypothetical protein